jgi:hypothetical protein
MAKNYGALAKQAENATKGIKNRELRKEAFRILLLQLMAGGGTVPRTTRKKRVTRKKRRPGPKAGRKKAKTKAKKKAVRKKARKRPGRRGGGVVTTALNRLLARNYFRAPKDAATVFKELRRRRVDIEPSQLRMELLRFTRARKLKRKIRMKGRKVTYLYGKR